MFTDYAITFADGRTIKLGVPTAAAAEAVEVVAMAEDLIKPMLIMEQVLNIKPAPDKKVVEVMEWYEFN